MEMQERGLKQDMLKFWMKNERKEMGALLRQCPTLNFLENITAFAVLT
jgi:hypothetical protein